MKSSKSKIYKSIFVILAISLTVGCTPTDDENNTTTPQQQGQQGGASNNNGSSNSSSSNGGEIASSFDIDNIDLSRCTIWDGEYIRSDKTLAEGCYKVTGTINLYGGTLTINPGTVLIFDSDSYLYVGGGTLNAVGTAEEPVVFTGLEKTPGYWRGIWMSGSTDATNELSHILVEYGGSSSNCGNLDISGSRVKISDSTFRYSGNDGFCIDSYSNIAQFERVTSVYNTKSAGKVYPDILGAMDSESNFTENTKDYITMAGGTVHRDTIWNELSVPVFVEDDVDVDNEATLTIKPGASFVFNSGTRFTVKGAIKAIGSGVSDAIMSTQEQLENNITEKPILFTGAEQIPGYWDGIEFDNSDSVENEFSHVIVEYAGGGGNYNANLGVGNGSRLKVSDCTFRYSENDGFYVDGYSDIDRFDRVTSTLNSKSAGKVHPKILNIINSSNDFSGNTKDYLTVMGGTVHNDATWYPINVPTMFIDDVDSEGTLTIQPGTTMKFDSRVDLEINGVLKAIGTDTNPITFTGSQDVPGQWRGIIFYLSDSTENEIAYCNISYGGSETYGANVYVGQGSRANVHDNVISNSGAYGVRVFSSKSNPINDDVESSNRFSNNARGDVNIE